MRYPSRAFQGGYGAYSAYISAATRYAALGAPTLYDHPGSSFGSMYSSEGYLSNLYIILIGYLGRN
jgi:hypothetical protein